MPVLTGQGVPQPGFNAFANFSCLDDRFSAEPCQCGAPGDFQPPLELQQLSAAQS